MDFFDLVTARRSVRAYTDAPVPDEIIKKLLEAAHWAPSAGNLQPWRFYVVKNKGIQKELYEKCYPVAWFKTAPLLIVVTADLNKSSRRYHERGAELYCLQDTAAAIQTLLLAAKSLGLGSCWLGAFPEEACAKILRLEKDVRPVAILPIGYPAEEPKGPGREPIEQAAVWME